MKSKILITGAGGNVGTETIKSFMTSPLEFEVIASQRNSKIGECSVIPKITFDLG